MTATETGAGVRVSSLEELKAAGFKVVSTEGRAILVLFDQGNVFALDNRCPHMGFPLHRGTVRDGILTCHWHHAKFDLAGGCTFDPFADDAPSFRDRGPRRRGLRRPAPDRERPPPPLDGQAQRRPGAEHPPGAGQERHRPGRAGFDRRHPARRRPLRRPQPRRRLEHRPLDPDRDGERPACARGRRPSLRPLSRRRQCRSLHPEQAAQLRPRGARHRRDAPRTLRRLVPALHRQPLARTPPSALCAPRSASASRRPRSRT